MKVIYFGTGSFAVPALRAVAPHVSLVVTQPDRPSGRGMRMQASAVKLVAEELGLPVATPEKARAADFVESVPAEAADILLVASYGQILSMDLLESARFGGINLHGSILPKYRGAAPIQRCLQNGDIETGVTLMQMAKGMDTGDMIAIAKTPILPDEVYGDLQDRLAVIAANLAQEWLPRLCAGDYPRTPQQDQEATIAPKVQKAEAELSPERSALEEYNRFRAFTPAPGAFLNTINGPVKLHQARLGTETAAPGVVLSTSNSCLVAFAGGSLHLLEVQPEGKKRMSGRDFANGLRIKPGSRLVEPI